MKAVVDTNVAIVANGRGTNASLQCQLKCLELLQNLTALKSKSKVFIDAQGLIMGEYDRHLYHKGQPGVGDSFYKFLHDNRYSTAKVKMVDIAVSADPEKGFEELPKNGVDRSDRKFLAVAVVAKAKIVNAVDSDWAEQHQLLTELGIDVLELCDQG